MCVANICADFEVMCMHLGVRLVYNERLCNATVYFTHVQAPVCIPAPRQRLQPQVVASTSGCTLYSFATTSDCTLCPRVVVVALGLSATTLGCNTGCTLHSRPETESATPRGGNTCNHRVQPPVCQICLHTFLEILNILEPHTLVYMCAIGIPVELYNPFAVSGAYQPLGVFGS